MGTATKSWAEAKTSALKTLGKKGKLPKERTDITGEAAKLKKAAAAFKTVQDALGKQLTDIQDASDSVDNAITSYIRVLDADKALGLDPKKDEDKDKIKDAKDTLELELGHGITQLENLKKSLDELDKAVTGFTLDDIEI